MDGWIDLMGGGRERSECVCVVCTGESVEVVVEAEDYLASWREATSSGSMLWLSLVTSNWLSWTPPFCDSRSSL